MCILLAQIERGYRSEEIAIIPTVHLSDRKKKSYTHAVVERTKGGRPAPPPDENIGLPSESPRSAGLKPTHSPSIDVSYDARSNDGVNSESITDRYSILIARSVHDARYLAIGQFLRVA